MKRTPVIDTLLAHRSVRAFRDVPLDPEAEATLREVMRRGPTSSALQTYTMVMVRDPELRARIRPHAGDQAYVERCGLLIVACSDLRRIRDAATERGYPYRAPDLRMLISSVEDLTIAVHNASLAAQSMGLGTVMIGGVANGMAEIHELLGLPTRVAPLLGLCVGEPVEDASRIPPRPRVPASVTVHTDRYALDAEREAEALGEHDREVVARGYYDGRRIPYDEVAGSDDADPVPDHGYGWTEHVARKQARHWWSMAGPKLRRDFATLGFRLDEDPTDPNREARRAVPNEKPPSETGPEAGSEERRRS